jgi:hypothetical protein
MDPPDPGAKVINRQLHLWDASFAPVAACSWDINRPLEQRGKAPVEEGRQIALMASKHRARALAPAFSMSVPRSPLRDYGGCHPRQHRSEQCGNRSGPVGPRTGAVT